MSILLKVISLPELINNLIQAENYSRATQVVCNYFIKLRLHVLEGTKLLKLIDKEVIGVLQQKLVKLLILRLQGSFLTKE